MISEERKILPKELSWQDSAFAIMNYYVCQQEGKDDRAKSIESNSISRNPEKYSTLKGVWENGNWEKALEEAGRRVEEHNLSQGCVEEYLFLLEKWSNISFEIFEVYQYDYAVGKILDEQKNYALLGRGGRKEVVEKICDVGDYRVIDKKETSWPEERGEGVDAVAIVIENTD